MNRKLKETYHCRYQRKYYRSFKIKKEHAEKLELIMQKENLFSIAETIVFLINYYLKNRKITLEGEPLETTQHQIR